MCSVLCALYPVYRVVLTITVYIFIMKELTMVDLSVDANHRRGILLISLRLRTNYVIRVMRSKDKGGKKTDSDKCFYWIR